MKEALDDAYETKLTKIEEYLSRKLSPYYSLEEVGSVAVKFKCSHQSGRVLSVDLLLSPCFSTQDELLHFLRKVESPIERLR